MEMSIPLALCSTPCRLSTVVEHCPGLIPTLAFWLKLTLPYGSDYKGQLALIVPFICLLEKCIFQKLVPSIYISSHMIFHNEMSLLSSGISFFSMDLGEPATVVRMVMLWDFCSCHKRWHSFCLVPLGLQSPCCEGALQLQERLYILIPVTVPGEGLANSQHQLPDCEDENLPIRSSSFCAAPAVTAWNRGALSLLVSAQILDSSAKSMSLFPAAQMCVGGLSLSNR